MESEQKGYSPDQACKLLGIGKTKFYAEMNSGKIPAKKHGRRTIISVEALERWFKNLPDYI